ICNLTDAELSDHIKACTNIVLEQFKAELIVTVIAQQLQVIRAAIKCFECRELGHIRKQCPKGPKGQKGNKKSIKPCHCQKGFHWSNQCQSKYDKHGNLLPQQENLKVCVESSAPQSNETTLNQTPI
ncbi:GAK6 protein, partial [Certhia familiaris]|nr:GAK6 protein [Certhia familiaris]